MVTDDRRIILQFNKGWHLKITALLILQAGKAF